MKGKRKRKEGGKKNPDSLCLTNGSQDTNLYSPIPYSFFLTQQTTTLIFLI